MIEIVAWFDDEDDAFACEVALIKAFGRIDAKTGSLCNLTNGGEGRTGAIATEATRKKLSEALTGRTRSDEHRKNISRAKAGKPLTDRQAKHLADMARSNLGRRQSADSSRKKSIALSGLKRSPEVVEAMRRRPVSHSIVSRLRTYGERMRVEGHTAEAKEKMSRALRGVAKSEEHKRKIGEAQKGKVIPPEQREKISAAMRAFYAKRRSPISE